MAQVAQPVNAIQSFFLTKNPPTTDLIKTPTFYAYKLYKSHQNATMIPRTLTCGNVSTKNLKVLTASASIDSTKKVHISLTNIDIANSQKLSIALNGYTFENASGEMVTGPSFNSINDYGAEIVNIKQLPESNITKNGNTGLTVALPAHSVVMLTLTPQGVGVEQKVTQLNSRFSMTSLSGNKIKIWHGFSKPTQVELSMCTVDGKLIAPVYQTVVGPDSKSFVWEPKLDNNSTNTVIVSCKTGGVITTQSLFLKAE